MGLSHSLLKVSTAKPDTSPSPVDLPLLFYCYDQLNGPAATQAEALKSPSSNSFPVHFSFLRSGDWSKERSTKHRNVGLLTGFVLEGWQSWDSKARARISNLSGFSTVLRVRFFWVPGSRLKPINPKNLVLKWTYKGKTHLCLIYSQYSTTTLHPFWNQMCRFSIHQAILWHQRSVLQLTQFWHWR